MMNIRFDYVAHPLLLLLAANAVVFPNANQVLLASLLGFASLLSIITKHSFRLKNFKYWLAPAFVTIAYCVVGIINGASYDAIIQALIIYGISPVLWILVIDFTWRLFGFERAIKYFAIISLLACVSVPIFIYLFDSYGATAVDIFGSQIKNVNIRDGEIGATMHVAGSLIFISAAFVAEPKVLKNKYLLVSLIFAIVFSVLSVGRTMAILALAIGVFFNVANSKITWKRLFYYSITIVGLITFLNYSFHEYYGIDILETFDPHLRKISDTSESRPEQVSALISGAFDNMLLGSGHGIGVDYIRSEDMPWRYEAVYFALLFKLGVLGLIIILYPFIASSFIFLKAALGHNIKKYDIFFGAAMFSSLAAGFTNPYPEAFSFQWMYVIPAYYFLSGVRRSAVN